MKTLEQIQAQLQLKFKKYGRTWFYEAFAGEAFVPVEIPLSAQEKDFHGSLGALQNWKKSIETLDGVCEIQTKTVRWRGFGATLTIPERIVIRCADALLCVVANEEQSALWKRASVRTRLVCDAGYGAMIKALIEEWHFISETPKDSDVLNLCALVDWLTRHRPANCYIREIPVPGIDTKWFEKHGGLVCTLLCVLTGECVRVSDLYERWDLRVPPALMRVRHAEYYFPSLPSGLTVGLTAEALNAIHPKALLLIENVQTGLSVKASDETLVIFGLGWDVKLLEKVSWIRDVPLLYMGDLDAHGLFILNHLREIAPKTRSVLMDCETLQQWMDFSVVDPTEDKKTREIVNLTREEYALFERLVSEKRRLEQERIPIEVINQAIKALACI